MNNNTNSKTEVEVNNEQPRSNAKTWEKPVVMRLAVGKAEGANNYDDDMDFKGAS